jgi:four helix bundle protein
MKRNNEIKKRLNVFALRVVKTVNALPKTTAGFELGRQLFRSGTSIAANYVEARGAFSKGVRIIK